MTKYKYEISRKKCISTKYVPPSNVRGSRIKADDGDGNTYIMHVDHSLQTDQNHAMACRALCEKMGWGGDMVGAWHQGLQRYFWVWK